MIRQTLITDYYKPIRGGLSLFAQFDQLISGNGLWNKISRKMRYEVDNIMKKPIATRKQTLMTDYYSTLVKPHPKSSKVLITDYFSPSHALQDFPSEKLN